MTDEESPLEASLQKLELDSCGLKKKTQKVEVENPFMRRRRSKSLSSINFGTTCDCRRKNDLHVKKMISFKRTPPNRKVLRDPVLKLIKCKHPVDNERISNIAQLEGVFGQCSSNQEQDFRSIIDACQQLSLANTNDGVENFSLPSFNRLRLSQSNVTTGALSDAPNVNTCAHQARLSVSPPCDVTIDELASYFETFVHIPKKMSSMAEMMYI